MAKNKTNKKRTKPKESARKKRKPLKKTVEKNLANKKRGTPKKKLAKKKPTLKKASEKTKALGQKTTGARTPTAPRTRVRGKKHNAGNKGFGVGAVPER